MIVSAVVVSSLKRDTVIHVIFFMIRECTLFATLLADVYERRADRDLEARRCFVVLFVRCRTQQQALGHVTASRTKPEAAHSCTT